MGTKTPEQCEALFKQHQSFLNLPNQPQLEVAFVAMVNDHYNSTKETDDVTISAEGEASADAGQEAEGDSPATSHPQASQKGRRTPRVRPRTTGTTAAAAASPPAEEGAKARPATPVG